MYRLIMTGLVLGLVSTSAYAQTTKEKLVAIEEGLNDASPIVRLVTLEEALADESSTIRDYAIAQALATDDKQLKGMAVNKFLMTKKKLTLLVEKSDEIKAKEAEYSDDSEKLEKFLTDSRSQSRIFKLYEPSILYEVASFNQGTGDIKGFCLKNKTSPSDNSTFIGTLIGNRLTIEHDCYVSSSSVTNSCTLQLTTEGESSFKGTMQCGEYFPVNISIPLN